MTDKDIFNLAVCLTYTEDNTQYKTLYESLSEEDKDKVRKAYITLTEEDRFSYQCMSFV